MAKNADAPDLEALYRRYGRAVYRRCQYFLRQDADAKDAMHEVFVKVALRYDDFRGQASPLTWMIRIATNHCLNELRGRRAGWRKRFERQIRIEASPSPTGRSSLERQELIRLALTDMPATLQQAAVHYFVDEMTQAQSAAACACSVPTLRKRLRQFVARARKRLQKDDVDIAFGDMPV